LSEAETEISNGLHSIWFWVVRRLWDFRLAMLYKLI